MREHRGQPGAACCHTEMHLGKQRLQLQRVHRQRAARAHGAGAGDSSWGKKRFQEGHKDSNRTVGTRVDIVPQAENPGILAITRLMVPASH